VHRRQCDVTRLVFRTELEKLVGFALATADLLGQMAAPDYVDKLPILYLEFAEDRGAWAESRPPVSLCTPVRRC